MSDCIFCKIITGEVPSHKVYEDERVLAFLDVNPINPGHTLIIPKSHHSQLWDLGDDEYQQLMSAAKKIALKIRQELKPLRVGQAVEGLAVDHAHVHLIPIEAGFEREFSKAKSDKNSPDELKAMAERLRLED